MDFYKLSEKIMGMNADSWEKHSSPKSVYSRYFILPLFSFAVCSRIWIGYYSLILVLFTVFIAWYNPRAFAKPKSSDNWASKATFGERIYLRRGQLDIPLHHFKAIRILTVCTSAGLPVLIYGLCFCNVWAIVLSNITIITFKTWLLDRMNWLYEDMKDSSEEFSGWLKL